MFCLRTFSPFPFIRIFIFFLVSNGIKLTANFNLTPWPPQTQLDTFSIFAKPPQIELQFQYDSERFPRALSTDRDVFLYELERRDCGLFLTFFHPFFTYKLRKATKTIFRFEFRLGWRLNPVMRVSTKPPAIIALYDTIALRRLRFLDGREIIVVVFALLFVLHYLFYVHVSLYSCAQISSGSVF